MKRSITLLALGATLGLGACLGGGSGPRTPDEFRIVKKAPLVIPPEYALRPPETGQARPVEVDPDRVGTTAFGQSIGASASAIERRLIAEADATAVSPVVRALVDYEQAAVLRKAPAAADGIVNWEDPGAPVEDSATGGREVVIERTPSDRRKLPGT